MERYVTLPDAEKTLRDELGIQIADQGIANLFRRGRGPQTALIHGRRLTRRSWLEQWVNDQAAQPTRRRCAEQRQQEQP